MILSGFPLIFCLFCSVSDRKSCSSVWKLISTSERHAEHLLAGQNTQQPNHLHLRSKIIRKASFILLRSCLFLLSPSTKIVNACSGVVHESRCIERTVHEPKNFYYGDLAVNLNILTSDRLSHKLVSNILQIFAEEVLGYCNVSLVRMPDPTHAFDPDTQFSYISSCSDLRWVNSKMVKNSFKGRMLKGHLLIFSVLHLLILLDRPERVAKKYVLTKNV